jgi:hypothetical protein
MSEGMPKVILEKKNQDPSTALKFFMHVILVTEDDFI